MKVADLFTELIECAAEEIYPPVCKTFINPGDNAPHDVCSKSPDGNDGQMWVAHLGSDAGWPAPTGEPVTCATAWREFFEIGIVRCAQSKIGDNGKFPAGDVITADATQQEEDRLALRRALICCLALEHKDLILEGWESIPPLGGCVGGVWRFYVRDAGCDCDAGS